MFGSGMRESREGEVVCVPDVSYSVYRALLDYLLSDEISEHLPTEAALELMMLANSYGVVRLEQLCARKLAYRLDASNVTDIARCADLINERHLLRAATKFMDWLSPSEESEGSDSGSSPPSQRHKGL